MQAGYRGPDEAGRQEPSEGETVMRTIRRGLRSRAQTRPRIPRKITRTGVGAALVAALTALGALAAANASAAPAAPAGHSGGHLSISKQFFGKTIEPYTGVNTPTYRYTLTNANGVSIDLLSYGAITQAIWVPSRNGHEADVVLGFKTLQDYVTFASPPVTANGGPYFGETVGRYANRIALGTFKLNGQTYTLPINNGVNALHGGLNGFGNHIWHQVGPLIHNSHEVGVTLQLVSPNGDESDAAGSPGCPNGVHRLPRADHRGRHVHAEQRGPVRHPLQGAQRLVDAEHGQNLTNHSYFNLAGESSAAGSAYGQYVQINANNYSPTDTTQIPLPAARRRPGRGHPVRLPRPAHHRFADQ